MKPKNFAYAIIGIMALYSLPFIFGRSKTEHIYHIDTNTMAQLASEEPTELGDTSVFYIKEPKSEILEQHADCAFFNSGSSEMGHVSKLALRLKRNRKNRITMPMEDWEVDYENPERKKACANKPKTLDSVSDVPKNAQECMASKLFLDDFCRPSEYAKETYKAHLQPSVLNIN